MKQMKKMLVFLLAVAMGMTMTACNESTQNESSKEESIGTEQSSREETAYDFGGVEVKGFGGFFSEWSDEENELAQEAKQVIEKKYNIKLVTAEMEGYDGGNDGELLLASVASGNPACDLIALGPESSVEVLSNDLLFDLTDYVDDFKVGSFFTDAATFNGKCYGISYDDICMDSLVYDRDYLKEIGMEKTPTDMFMEGKWDYDNFKAYLIEMKSKLPDGVYPIGQYPYHWATMAASANGVPLAGQDFVLNYNNDAVIEATEFYQELLNEGLACPPEIGVDEDGNTQYTWHYSFGDEKIVLGRAEHWALGGFTQNYGVVYWPWGSNITCEGDYTTLSDNYKVARNYIVFMGVVDATKTGIPGNVLMQIAMDYSNEVGNRPYLRDSYEAEQAGNYQLACSGAGTARSFRTEQDIELYDWATSRNIIEWTWALDSAGLVKCWEPWQNIYGQNLDARSTLESYQKEGAKALEDAGFPQK